MGTMIRIPMRKITKVKEKMDPFFPVETQKYIREDGVYDGLRAIVNMTNKKTLGNIGKTYNLSTHRDVSNTVREFLEQIGVDYTTDGGAVGSNGSRYFETIGFPKYAFNPATTTGIASTAIDLASLGAHARINEEVLIPFITAKNSYDKTAAVSWSYGVARPWCSNGCSIITREDSLSFKHSQHIDIDHVRDTLLSHLDSNMKLIERIYTRLNNETGTEYLRSLIDGPFSDKFKLALIEKIAPHATIKMVEKTMDGEDRKVWEIESASTGESGWAIYNVATDIASHALTARVEQEVVGRKIAKVFGVK